LNNIILFCKLKLIEKPIYLIYSELLIVFLLLEISLDLLVNVLKLFEFVLGSYSELDIVIVFVSVVQVLVIHIPELRVFLAYCVSRSYLLEGNHRVTSLDLAF